MDPFNLIDTLKKSQNSIVRAGACAYERKARIAHPVGQFDTAGRWYPATSERLDKSRYRAPSARYPLSYQRACRSEKHIFGVLYDLTSSDAQVARRIARALAACETCTLSALLESLGPKGTELCLEALSDSGLSNHEIIAAMPKNGIWPFAVSA